MTPVLEGTRVRLEPMTMGHLSGLEAVAFDNRLWRYTLDQLRTREDLERYMRKAMGFEETGIAMPWVTVLKTKNRVIGSTRFMDLDRVHKTTEIGWTWLAPEFQGSGLNAEVKLLQLTYAFEELQLNRVALKTHHENLRSQAAMRKIGAVEEGTFRNHMVMPDGSLRHSVWFSIIREEWPQARSLLEARVRATQPSA
jgi:RimJ/RimL family protein N-acetyltransferase